MLGILVQSRDAAPRQDSARPHGAPRVIPSTADPANPSDRVPQRPIGLSLAVAEPSRCIPAGAALSVGSLLYLGFVGLVAAGIVAVFFGTGFSLLVPSAGGTISGSATRAPSEVISLPPSPGNDEQQTFPNQAPADENKDAAQSSAALPAPAMADEDAVPHGGGSLTPKAPSEAPASPAATPVPTPNALSATALAPPTFSLSTAELSELLEHGDALLRTGDVASARLFYERAASAGDGRAALRLGATFDPAFLGRLGLGKLQADPAAARSWFGRALDLGAVEAKRQLNSLETRQGK